MKKQPLRMLLIWTLSAFLMTGLSSCASRKVSVTETVAVLPPDQFLEVDPMPSPPNIGAALRDVRLYIQSLQQWGLQCNRDKEMLQEWKTGATRTK